MGQKDIAEKSLIACADVFADLMNFLISPGKKTVREEELVDAQPHSQFKDDGQLHEQIRDVAKYWKEGQVVVAMCGIENQTAVDRTMIFRMPGYDGIAYHMQAKRGGPFYPVASFVLYFGTEHRWTGPRTLHEALQIREELKPFVPDYKLNILEVAWISEEQIKLFTSDFRYVVEYLVMKRLHKEYHPSKEQIRHVDEVLKLMTVLTGDPRFEGMMNSTKEGSRPQTMCEMIDRFITEGRIAGLAEGRIAGLAEGRIAGLAEGRAAGLAEADQKYAVNMLSLQCPVKEICKLTGFSVDALKKLATQHHIEYSF